MPQLGRQGTTCFNLARCVPSLLAVLGSLALPQAQAASLEIDGVQLEVPHWQVNHQGVHYAPAGFVLNSAEHTLLGDALRWDQEHDILFATGRIRLNLPGIIIHAESLGSRLSLRQGEAWDVTLWYRHGSIERQLSAQHLRWNDHEVTASGISGTTGYGGLISIAAQSLTIARREQPDPLDEGPGKHLRFARLKHLRVHLAGVPIWYWPHVYRDFVRDYPWTRYRVSHNSRRGWGLDAGIGWRLSPWQGWHLRPQIEIDAFEELGTGITARLRGEHDTLGTSELLTWGVQHGPHHRNQWGYDGYDLAWQNSWQYHDRQDALGPVGAARLRWTHLPNSWPGEHPKQLYHDLLDQDFEHRALPRQGGSMAQHWAHVGLSLDRAGFADDARAEAERDLALALTMPTQRVVGDIHAQAELQSEQWGMDDEVLGRWFGGSVMLQHHQALPHVPGIAIRHRAGLLTQASDEWSPAGTALNDEHGLQAEMAQSWQFNLWRPGQILRPEIGWRYASQVLGDPLPAADWPMPRRLREAWYLDSALGWNWQVNQRWQLTADGLLSWRWSTQSQELQEDDAEINLLLEGPRVALHARWQWQPDLGQQADLDAHWRVWRWLRLESQASRQDQEWQWQPSIIVDSERYALRFDWRWDELSNVSGSRRWTGFQVSAERRLVDGQIGISYEWQRDEKGAWLDESMSLSWTLHSDIIP